MDSEYGNSIDHITSKLDTVSHDINQLKLNMIHFTDENKINFNAITSIKVSMTEVNDKIDDQKRESNFQVKHIDNLRSSQYRDPDNITKLLKIVTTHSLKLNPSGPTQII